MEKDIYANSSPKRAGVAILIDKIDFKTKIVIDTKKNTF